MVVSESGAKHCPVDGQRLVRKTTYDSTGGDPLLGTVLADRYTIVGRLGAGGMGTVYRAEQSPIGREVALKVLKKELGRDPETVVRFQREARTLSQLKHPNTVTIFDFGQTKEGLLFLAMELLEGEMLSARLKQVGAIEVETAVKFASGVLRSLDEAHARGIIHRDLKPDNIYLARVHGRPDEGEIVKVVDFGIAKIRDGETYQGLDPVATQEGTVFGTPRYMSPEQAQGKALDGRSDLYAVGVLLFHMLTGAAPFTDDDAVIVMAHHIKTEPPPVRTIVPDRGIPESLERLVARALSKDPAERPQTAQDFLTELEAAAQDIKAARTSTSTLRTAATTIPTAQGPRRSLIAAAALMSVVIAVVVGFARIGAGSSGVDRQRQLSSVSTRGTGSLSGGALQAPAERPAATRALVDAVPSPVATSDAGAQTNPTNATAPVASNTPQANTATLTPTGTENDTHHRSRLIRHFDRGARPVFHTVPHGAVAAPRRGRRRATTPVVTPQPQPAHTTATSATRTTRPQPYEQFRD
jgi:serine/threonine-protein kinase